HLPESQPAFWAAITPPAISGCALLQSRLDRFVVLHQVCVVRAGPQTCQYTPAKISYAEQSHAVFSLEADECGTRRFGVFECIAGHLVECGHEAICDRCVETSGLSRSRKANRIQLPRCWRMVRRFTLQLILGRNRNELCGASAHTGGLLDSIQRIVQSKTGR